MSPAALPAGGDELLLPRRQARCQRYLCFSAVGWGPHVSARIGGRHGDQLSRRWLWLVYPDCRNAREWIPSAADLLRHVALFAGWSGAACGDQARTVGTGA